VNPDIKVILRSKRVRTLVALLALALIGGGLAWIYYPLGPLGVGLLVWFDLKLDEVRRK
jgi:hypothetical protein